MPSKPQRMCPKCGWIGPTGTKCPNCSRRYNQQRGSARARGYTTGWDAYSKDRLVRFPFCVGYPKGVHKVPTMATCTDHILSASKYPELFNDPNNHQSMCDDCNKRKAIAEEGGFGR